METTKKTVKYQGRDYKIISTKLNVVVGENLITLQDIKAKNKITVKESQLN